MRGEAESFLERVLARDLVDEKHEIHPPLPAEKVAIAGDFGHDDRTGRSRAAAVIEQNLRRCRSRPLLTTHASSCDRMTQWRTGPPRESRRPTFMTRES